MCQNNIWPLRSPVNFFPCPWGSWANSPDSPSGLCSAGHQLGQEGPGASSRPVCSPAVLCPGSVLPSTCHSNLSLLRFKTWLEHFIHHSTLLQRIVVMVLYFSACFFFNKFRKHTHQVKQIKHVMRSLALPSWAVFLLFILRCFGKGCR